MNQTIQEGPGGDDHRSRANAPPISQHDSANNLSLVGCRWSCVIAACFGFCRRQTTIDYRLQNQIRNFRLLDLQVRLRFQHIAHLQPVCLLIALRPRRPYRRTARRIKQTELNPDGVGHFAHDAAQCVHFAHQMTLGNSADRGITRHLRD